MQEKKDIPHFFLRILHNIIINNNKNNNNDITSFTKFPSLNLDKICVNCIYITFPTEDFFFHILASCHIKEKHNLIVFMFQF